MLCNLIGCVQHKLRSARSVPGQLQDVRSCSDAACQWLTGMSVFGMIPVPPTPGVQSLQVWSEETKPGMVTGMQQTGSTQPACCMPAGPTPAAHARTRKCMIAEVQDFQAPAGQASATCAQLVESHLRAPVQPVAQCVRQGAAPTHVLPSAGDSRP